MKPSKQPVFLFGASGHAKVVIDIIEKAGDSRVLGLFDDNPALAEGVFFGYALLGGRTGLVDRVRVFTHAPRAIVTIGDNTARRSVSEWLASQQIAFATAIHPKATIGKDVSIGAGTVVMAGAVVNSATELGSSAIINTGSSVDHDCTIGAFVHVAPGCRLCGGITIGDAVMIGAGAVLIPGIRVGANAVIGAGSTVIRDVPSGARVVGSPARTIGMSNARR